MQAETLVAESPKVVEPAAKPKRRRRWLRVLKVLACLLVVSVCGGMVAVLLFWQRQLDLAAAKLPELPNVVREVYRTPTQIVSSDGETLFTVTSQYRKPLRLHEIPQHVLDAMLAAEDKRFYQHDGVDEWALMRVAWTAARDGRSSQGASTLTMQIAKRVFTGTERTIERKLKDMALATVIERTWTKDQILEFYMNEVFFGAGAYGIAAAADVYFGKSVQDLTVGEAALLARCVRRPSDDNPFLDPTRAKANRDVVLSVMHDEGMIDSSEFVRAKAEPITLRPRPPMLLTSEKRAPYFVDWVLEELRRELPGVDVTQGGYRVETSINLRMQAVAEEQVGNLIRRYRGRRITTAAFLLMDREGRVLAMVGGADYKNNQFNIVTQGRRQPGSAFKPFVYAAALEYGVLSPYSSISNAPFVLRAAGAKPWVPRGGGTGGYVTMATALRQSINVPAVRTMDMVGPSNVIHLAHKGFGFRSELRPYLSLALGAAEVSPLEMAEGYSVFMRGGDRVRPTGILRVYGPDGNVAKEIPPAVTYRTVRVATARDLDLMMRGVVTGGTGTGASSVANARGKTGTTSDFKDAWFCGYTDTLLGIGWVGNEVLRTQADGSRRARYASMGGVFGGKVVAPMWASIVRPAQQMLGESRRYVPSAPAGSSRRRERTEDDEVRVPVYPEDDQPAETEAPEAPPIPDEEPAFIPPEPPVEAVPISRDEPRAMVVVEVCADTGRRATAYCPERSLRTFAVGSGPSSSCTAHRPH